MTVISHARKLAYFAVPKVACTSVKTMFFQIENGFGFREFRANGRMWHIHNFYPTLAFNAVPHDAMTGYTRLAILRDPVRRLLSCYSNRVLYHRELSEDQAGQSLAAAGLPADPDLPTFIRNLDAYRRAVVSIDHHARPMVDFLGREPAFFDRLFRMEALEDFMAEVERITGMAPALGRLQSGGPKIAPDSLSSEEIGLLRDYYAEDYDCYGDWL